MRGGWVAVEYGRKTEGVKPGADKRLVRTDVLVNLTGLGTLGRVARWTRQSEATVDSHVSIVRFSPDRVDPVVAGQVMLRMEPTIAAMGEGSTGQTELSRSRLAELSIPLPGAQDQAALGPILRSIGDLRLAGWHENAKLGELREALLPLLMSGRLRIRDAEKQVEQVV